MAASTKRQRNHSRVSQPAEQVRDELTAKALAALEQGGDAQAIMQDLAWKLTNRLIHAPTKSLQQAARDGDNERLNILRDSLGLE